MSYEVDKNSAGSVRRRTAIGIPTMANSSGREGASPHYRFYELEPAIVVNINTKDSPNTAQRLGEAIVRPLYSFSDVPEEMLPIAVPLYSNIKNYPLKNEIVIVVYYGNRLYYTDRVNFFNNINQNCIDDLAKISQPQGMPGGDYDVIQTGNANVTSGNADKNIKPGDYFKENKKIKSILPLEGDIIFEGRFGNSIRLGGTVNEGTDVDRRMTKVWSVGKELGSPIIIIRNGQPEVVSTKDNQPIVEDLNKDASSIYLTSDQTIQLQPASKNLDSYKGKAPSIFDGKQVIIDSDRLIFNARTKEIFLFSNTSIGLSTVGSLNIDASKFVVVNSPKISLGLDAKEHLMLGDTSAQWLRDLIRTLNDLVRAIEQSYVLTGTGPSSPIQQTNAPLYQPITQQLTTLSNQIQTLLSKQNVTL